MPEEFRIGDYNYAFDGTVGISASSEDASFPVSNLRRFQLSKVLRTTGNFVIDSTNNKIDFKESGGGPEKTATLTSGVYTPDELAAEIARAMEAAGTVGYSASFSTTTGYWTISTEGSYLSLLWSSGVHATSSICLTIGFQNDIGTALNDDSTGATSYTGSSIALHTEEWVLFDLRAPQAIDSFALIFDKMIGSKFTNEAVLTLQASMTDVWTAPPVDVTLSFDEIYEIVTYFRSAAASYRFWRLKMVDPRNPKLYLEVPKVFLTKATQLTQMPQIGLAFKNVDRSIPTATPYGHRYVDLYPQLREFDFKYAALSEADLETLDEIFQRVGNAAPIFIALDPLATLFDKDRFFIYGYLVDTFAGNHVFYSFFDTGLKLQEAL